VSPATCFPIRPRALGSFLLGVLALPAWAPQCRRHEDPPPPAAAQVAGAATPAQSTAAWHEFEQRRDAAAVLEAASGSLAPEDRRSAARALARVLHPKGTARLRQFLADDDLEVVTWAAFGLGQNCDPAASIVKELLSRSASLYALEGPGAARHAALRSVATAVGSCGSEAAEDALRAWLSEGGELAEHAAWGLGQLATRHGHLAEKTQVALLTTAARGQSPGALFPFTRLTRLSEAVQARVLDVAGQALTTEAGALRSFAVRALPQAGPTAVGPLGQVLRNAAFTPEERAMAAQALGRLGRPGQETLAAAASDLPLPDLSVLESLGEDGAEAHGAVDSATRDRAERALAGSGVWSALLAQLEAPGAAKERLAELASWDVPPTTNPLGRRRAIAMRCRAADLLAGPNPGDPVLRACDPDDSAVGALAVLRALDRSPLEGSRLGNWRNLAADERAPVRQSALRLLGSHGEVTDSAALLRTALESDQIGTSTTALQVLAAYPARGAPAAGGAGDVDRELALAVEAILKRSEWSGAIETLGAALDAAGALGVLSLKGVVESYCKSPHVELRAHAARALGLLGDPKRRCDEAVVWPRASTAPSGAVVLAIDSAVGPLRLLLDGSRAPAAVGRIVELARSGYYDGLAVHRVVEGFVVQFGDKHGDGFGDPTQAPLPCERSPEPFEPLDVGMAIAGRDTATTQWFVALDRYPQLDGAYTRIGRAEGPWRLLAEGDRIRAVRVAEK
jgi:cyclophilin family peptidyl-prolyl cis-trans isomerase